jgi:hypothetical protein
MKSWKANGLLEYVQETYLYIDGALSSRSLSRTCKEGGVFFEVEVEPLRLLSTTAFGLSS